MRTLVFALASCVLMASPAWAERMSLDYAGSAWGLLGVGGAHLDVDVDDNDYSARATIRSGGVAALFLHTRIDVNSGGVIDNGALRWRRYGLDHMYDGVHRYISMRPEGTGVYADINPTYPEWGDPVTSEAQKRSARDPLSSLIAMAADVGATRRCQGNYNTFDGRWLYRIEVRSGERTEMTSGPYRGPAMRCRVHYIPVAGFTPDDQGYRDPPPPGSVWFALLDGRNFAPPIRAAMPLPLGTATLDLRRFEITPSVAPAASH